MNERAKATADKLVQYCREGKEAQGLDEYYHPDCVSAEVGPMPGQDSNEVKGVDAIKGKHDWWNANMEVHDQKVEGPFPHADDRFAVIFEIDATDKNQNQRTQMKEVALYHCDDQGKIVREEFFYQM